jgi:membrane protease YdiL (CAAX protease family)
LVIFGGFQGAQLLTLQLASLFGEALSPSARMLAAYLVAGIALWVMTLREQEHTHPSHRARLAPLGLAVGASSGAFAWLYLRLVHPSSSHAAPLDVTSPLELALVGLAIVGVAPIVEERFFRGWLQLALARALGKRAIWAPVLTGLAFAAAHPAYSFAPVLVLGVLNGFLMRHFRSLSACMVAHAVHNALALYFGGSR